MTPKLYSDDELLSLSGIQHFFFCKRQWALIHVEQGWQENRRTAEGRIVHQNVDDPTFQEVRNGIRTLRSVKVLSRQLGLYGVCDQVDVLDHDGMTDVYPVEYKVGKPKIDDRDRVQLCAQCICLEEMFRTRIDAAYLYYHETRRRSKVEMTEDLRDTTRRTAEEMHVFFDKGITPPPINGKSCEACSLTNICMPTLGKKRIPVKKYIQQGIEGR